MSKSIAIFGGNGFLGRKICEVGVKLGYSVTSFSRTGDPAADIQNTPWAQKVHWERANIFDPDTYADKLGDKTAVVHSIGILFENSDYKKVVNSNFNFLNDIQKLGNFLKGPNPMAKNKYSTYEAIQRDSAVILADAYIQQQKKDPTFVYISADQQIPLIPEGYITTKREAEFELACKPLREILMRPGFMYDEQEGSANNRKLLKQFVELGYNVKQGVVGSSVPFLNTLVRPPCSTDQVALKIYQRLENPEFLGVVTLEDIRAIS